MALKIFLLVTFVASTVHGLPTDEKLTRSSLQDYKESIGMYDGSLTTIQKHPYMTYDDDDPTHPLRQGWMRWYDVEICATEYKVWLGLNWTNRMACAYNRGKTTLCREDFGAGLVHGGVLYGMFAGTGDMFCSQYSSPALLADVKTGVPWLRKITGAK
uniref:Peptidase S1 domain-containing protein n=1 Tax=Graphocephala atropunctata TaxID=36148 RepID=A0A1B6LR82_9HEMI